jgi:dihydropteroate synthase
MNPITCKGKQLFFDVPLIMGIVNATPDSFYSPSQNNTISQTLHTVDAMLQQGANIIDIGGQSTRPQANFVLQDQELQRVIPIVEAIIKKYPSTIISIDTFNASVAKAAIESGASIVNDISAGNFDSKMIETVAQLKVPFIAMHQQGNWQSMHQNTHYNNLLIDIYDAFTNKIIECNQAGIKDIILDVGFGFSKTIEQNFSVLKNLQHFETLDKPIMVGVSRKSAIYKTLNIIANEALNATTVANTIALANGANILRVHDVKEAAQAVALLQKMKYC